MLEIPYLDGKLMRLDWDINFKNTDYYGYVYYPDYEFIDKQPKECQQALYEYHKYFICPRNTPEDKIIENLIEARREDMHARWDIKVFENMYVRDKWDECHLNANVKFEIYRNDILFDCGFAIDLNRAYVAAQSLLQQYQNNPTPDLWEIDFDKKMKGRKVYYCDEPALIDHFEWGEGYVWVIPDKNANCLAFKCPERWKRDKDIPMYWDDYAEGLKVPLLSKEIDWFRD